MLILLKYDCSFAKSHGLSCITTDPTFSKFTTSTLFLATTPSIISPFLSSNTRDQLASLSDARPRIPILYRLLT